MKKVLSCFLIAVFLFVNLGIVSLAVNANTGIPITYTLSDSIDYDKKQLFLPPLSGEAPEYFYTFDNGKPNWNSYSLLDDCQKKIYDYIINSPKGSITITMEFEYGEFLYSNFVNSYLSEVMYAVCNDHPDIFYYNGYSIPSGYLYDNTCVKIFEYNVLLKDTSTYTAENIAGYHTDMINAMKSVPVDTSNRYNFVKSLHDYLCNTIYYPDLDSSDYIGNSHDAYGALVEKRAVCQGYADAFKLICDYYKIPCVCIAGSTTGGAHMWNAVQMDDGLWYLIDATWNDQTEKPTNRIHYDFFLIGTNTKDTYFGGLPFSQSHVMDSDLFLPALKYATDKYIQENHFTEFGATYNSIAKKDGKYLIRSYFDVYDSFIYYNGMFVEVNSPATNSTFTVKSGTDGAEEDWTLVSVCDCNGDALADINDYTEAVNKVLAGTAVETVYDMAADPNCDGYLDVIDLEIIQRAVTGKNTNIVLE